MNKYPVPTLVWLELIFPSLTKRERVRIAKRIDYYLEEGIVPESLS